MSGSGEQDLTPGGHKREVFGSRMAFYFAAVGAAVGFGNVWRFPSLSVIYGGGAFFVPYLMALFLIGIPLTVLEIGFGQYFQTGDIGVFGSFHPRLRGVGLSSVACGFMLNTYYSVLIAWVINAFFDSWSDNAPWDDPDLTGEIAVDYFINDIIGASTVGADGRPTRVVGKNVGYAFIVWLIVYVCLSVGIKWTGRITYFTMGLPIILLFVFLGKAVSLEGSADGIHEYIGIWDMSILRTKGEVWSVAVSQIFFSIGITFGILTAYGSHCPRNEPVFLNSCVVALSNSFFSFIAGFAVFAALGHLAFLEGKEVTELGFGGFSLVFGTWPVVMNTLPGGAHWVRLLFLDLFLLGIDSAFAFMEAVITVLHDTVYFKDVPKHKLLLGPIVLSFLLCIIYCTDAGLNFLDVIDFYINFVMIIVGFFESFASAWIYGMLDQYESMGQAATLSYMGANFLGVFVACGLWYGLKEDALMAGFVGGFGVYFVGLAITAYFLKKKMDEVPGKWTWGSIWWELSFGNIVALRDKIQPIIGYVPFAWCVLMKQFIPHVLIVLFVNLASSETLEGDPVFGGYGGYDMHPYQALGICTFVFAASTFLIGAIFPKLYEPLALPQTKESAEEVSKWDRKSKALTQEGDEPKKVDDGSDGSDSEEREKVEDVEKVEEMEQEA